MPKKNDDTRSKMRSKSTRKLLLDVSNSKTAIKSVGFCRKTSEEEVVGDNPQDCLLLVHSDISSLLRQIDELVVQALQLTSKKGRKEIKQFADVLSEMHTSLKPWVPRFQKALSNPSIQTEKRSEQPKEGKPLVCVQEEDTDVVIESPEETKWESLISPSPLVSWRAECRTEKGRQLFLLTPLHKTKTFSAKRQVSSVPVNEKITSEETFQPVSHLDSVRNLSENQLEGVSANSTLNKVLNLQVTKTVTDFENGYASPAKFSNCSKLVMMTPSLKMSPPKSCMFLEPVSEFKKKNHKSTPFPTRTQNCSDSLDSESSSHETDGDFNLKYPELFGIKLAHTAGNRMKVLEESPSWNISPPITCTIMEPIDEKTLTNLPAICSPPKTTLADNQQGNLSLVKKIDHQQVESTPMFKEPASSFRMGKHPGENTLKRELWVKFDAATTTHDGIRFNDVTLQKTSQKGFLDRLDEASDAQWNL